MSAIGEPLRSTHSPEPMSVFERHLTVWVLLCIIAGIALGQFALGVFQAIGCEAAARMTQVPVHQ